MSTYSGETVTRVNQYTNLALNEGLFDQLMTAVDNQLDKQFKLDRIRGTAYGEVYVASIQGAMQNATQYLLGTMFTEEQRAKLVAETSLTAKQEEKIDIEKQLLELEREKLRFEIDKLYPLQELKATAEVTLIEAQISKINKEIEFLTAKIRTEQANTTMGIADANSLIGKQMDILSAQKLGFAGDLQIKATKILSEYDTVFLSVWETPGAAELALKTREQLALATAMAQDIKDI